MTFPNLPFPVPGRTGGGCISSGPFKNRNVSLGMGRPARDALLRRSGRLAHTVPQVAASPTTRSASAATSAPGC